MKKIIAFIIFQTNLINASQPVRIIKIWGEGKYTLRIEKTNFNQKPITPLELYKRERNGYEPEINPKRPPTIVVWQYDPYSPQRKVPVDPELPFNQQTILENYRYWRNAKQ